VSLPPALRPWWPLFKKLHLRSARLLGHLFRRLSPLLGARGLPRRATDGSVLTAAGEPDVVVLHPGRPEEPLRRPATPGDPANHWLFEAVRTATEPSPRVPAVTVPATFTLEVAGGRLTGDYGALSTPGKVLDHETSTYFGVVDWREHPIFLRPTTGRTEHLSGTVLSLTTRGTAVNYYHFLYDAIGRLAVLEDSLPDWQADTVIVPHLAGYQRQLLELVGVTGRLVQPARGRSFTADRLLVPSNPNWALQAPPATVAWLRDRLRPTSAAGRSDAPTRLYLTRGTARRNRRYVEEAELWPELERRGFVMVDPGTFRVQEQIDLFAGAEVIVAPHGAGLTNVTFSPPGVRVLEMFAGTYVHLGLWAICQAIGADYHYLVADGSEGPAGANAGILDDVSIPPARVLAAVDDLLTEMRGRP
jgi:capsular polysaccharide biosynthesis protein